MAKRILTFVLLIFFCLQECHSSGQSPKTFKSSLIYKIKKIVAFSFILPSVVSARKGAFEMDVELYFNNLVNGNQGKKLNSPKNPLPSPRKIDAKFANDLLEIVDMNICKISGAIEKDITETVNRLTPDALSYFREFAPVTSEDLSDQYYFDIIIFLHYLFAKNAIIGSEERVKLRENIACGILRLLNVPPELDKTAGSPTEAISIGIKRILEQSVKYGLIESFTLDNRFEDLLDLEYVQSTFKAGLSIDFQFTLTRPAWILGWLEFAGPRYDTFFHPEFVASVICQWIKQFGYNAKFEDYPLDNYYRVDAVQAQDAIIEMSVSLSNKR